MRKKQRQAKIPNTKPSCDESKISASHSALGATIPEWGGRNPYSGMISWYWKTEKSDLWLRWPQRAAWCECSKATRAEDSVSALQISLLSLPCFRVSLVWSCGLCTHKQMKQKINSGSTFSDLVTSKSNPVCTSWLLWGVNWSTVSGDGPRVAWTTRPTQMSNSLWLWSPPMRTG